MRILLLCSSFNGLSQRVWAELRSDGHEVTVQTADGDDAVRAAVAELDGLKRALGRSTVVALKALLPFSRNDYWELAELRQRLSRS